MIVKFTFGVQSDIRLDDCWPITVGDTTFEVNTRDDGTITSISTSIKENNEQHWPSIIKNDEQYALSVNAGHQPHLKFIIDDLVVIQGMLSVYRHIRIDLTSHSIEWIAENDEERRKLQLTQFSSKSMRGNAPPLPFDLVARSVLSHDHFRDFQIPLSFYRKAITDIDNKQYINSFYNLFFFLECLYAKGKSDKKQMRDEFMKSDELLNAINLASAEYQAINNETSSEIFKLITKKATVAELLWHLIGRRGFLHHHNIFRKDIWHPEFQDEWEADTRFCQIVCYNIAFHRMGDHFFSKELERSYFDMSTKNGACLNTKVEFVYITLDGNIKSGVIPIRTPGTKATHRLSEYVAKQFFDWFDVNLGEYNSLLSFSIKTEDGTIVSSFQNHVKPI